jgi:hypothetical protein
MDISVDLYKVPYNKLINKSKEIYPTIFNNEENEKLLIKIINSFGEVMIQGDTSYLVILHNEFYNDYTDPLDHEYINKECFWY